MAVRITPSYTDKLLNSNFLKKSNHSLYINFSILIIFYLFLFNFFQKGFVQNIWWGHLYLNNYNLNVLIIINFITLIMFIIFNNTNIKNIILNNDFFFSIINLSLIVPLIYYSNSFYNFFFILELTSILIFYKFVVSKFWSKSKDIVSKKNNLLEKNFSRNFINVLFFQYWVNFFSSVILLISIINIVYLYGSTDWVLLNLLNLFNNNILYFNDFELNTIIWVSLLMGFFLKIGLTPSHLFKIEVYKGIPFLSIFFYTTFYFLSYFIFFLNFIYLYINSFKNYFLLFFIIFILLGVFYTLFLLFDVSFSKAFFAYSTVVNSIAFISLLITIL